VLYLIDGILLIHIVACSVRHERLVSSVSLVVFVNDAKNASFMKFINVLHLNFVVALKSFVDGCLCEALWVVVEMVRVPGVKGDEGNLIIVVVSDVADILHGILKNFVCLNFLVELLDLILSKVESDKFFVDVLQLLVDLV